MCLADTEVIFEEPIHGLPLQQEPEQQQQFDVVIEDPAGRTYKGDHHHGGGYGGHHKGHYGVATGSNVFNLGVAKGGYGHQPHHKPHH